jgi:hypothetical protein
MTHDQLGLALLIALAVFFAVVLYLDRKRML